MKVNRTRSYTIEYILCPCTLYTEHCTLYAVHCTLNTVHYTLYTVTELLLAIFHMVQHRHPVDIYTGMGVFPYERGIEEYSRRSSLVLVNDQWSCVISMPWMNWPLDRVMVNAIADH